MGKLHLNPPIAYQPFIYRTFEPGYVSLQITTNLIDNNAFIYYDSDGCGTRSTHYPHEEYYCLVTNSTRKVNMVVPSYNEKDHYINSFNWVPDKFVLKYDFDSTIEIELGGGNIYE
jgi:hypothetical protein